MSEKMFSSEAPHGKKKEAGETEISSNEWNYNKDFEGNIKALIKKALKENKTQFMEADGVKIIISPEDARAKSFEYLYKYYLKKWDKKIERDVDRAKQEQLEKTPEWQAAWQKKKMEYPIRVAEERRKIDELMQALPQLNFDDPKTVLNWCYGFLKGKTANVKMNAKEILSIFKAHGFTSKQEEVPAADDKKGEREYRRIVASMLDAIKTNPPVNWEMYIQEDIEAWEKKFGKKEKGK